MNGDESIPQRLQQLAEKCMSRGLTVKRLREELPPTWQVDGIDASDAPNAFLINTSGSEELWVVPNTREWLPFRGLGWFEVIGSDVISARITVLRRLPRLGRLRKVVQLGSVEVSV